MMAEQRYILRAQDGRILLSEDDLRDLGLSAGQAIGERELRRRADQLTNRSLREAIHAMLDNEEPEAIVRVVGMTE